jgi:hypothetical protein
MSNTISSQEQVNMAAQPDYDGEKKRLEASQIERVMTPDELQKDAQDYSRIDVSKSQAQALQRHD